MPIGRFIRKENNIPVDRGWFELILIPTEPTISDHVHASEWDFLFGVKLPSLCMCAAGALCISEPIAWTVKNSENEPGTSPILKRAEFKFQANLSKVQSVATSVYFYSTGEGQLLLRRPPFWLKLAACIWMLGSDYFIYCPFKQQIWNFQTLKFLT